MADALKTFFSPALVRRLAADITRVHQDFPTRSFIKAACAGLDRLELLDRGRHIARALSAHVVNGRVMRGGSFEVVASKTARATGQPESSRRPGVPSRGSIGRAAPRRSTR